jgi:hypothetical protein
VIVELEDALPMVAEMYAESTMETEMAIMGEGLFRTQVEAKISPDHITPAHNLPTTTNKDNLYNVVIILD